MADLELLDCGDGRRLERLAEVVVDRPAPAAVMPRRLPAADWRRAALRWSGTAWDRGGDHEPWPVRAGGLMLECRPAGGGQVGVFRGARRDLGLARRGRACRRGAPRAPARRAVPVRATPAGRRSPARAPGPGSPTSTPPGPRSPGRAGTRSSRGSATGPSGGSSTTRARSCAASAAGAARYDGVVLDPPSYGHGTGRGGSPRTSSRCSRTSPPSSAPARPSSCSPRTPRGSAARASPRSCASTWASPRPPARPVWSR